MKTINLRQNILLYSFLLIFSSCHFISKVSYGDSLVSPKTKDHYLFPKQKMGRFYWSVRSESVSLEERLVQESLCGLAALAVNEGNSQTMVWIHSDVPAYQRLQNNLPMQETGNSSIWDLLGKTELMSEWVNGYILYDIDNPESVNIATVASHVYKGILVSINDSARFNKLGYGMLYNASSKTLDECWTQFKDKCNKDGLVLMPPLTSNQRSTAIAYRWMAVNLYKKQEGSSSENNKELIYDILMDLEPLSPVIGWEQSSSEDEFVSLVSESGNIMLPFDWAINTPLLSAGYENRIPVQAQTTDPKKIAYGDAENYIAFWLSDGDNIQWMINSFDTPSFYDNPHASELAVSFGYPFTALSMVSPSQHAWLIQKQPKNTSLVESLGGGYYYPDNFGKLKNRDQILDKLSWYLANHMNSSASNVLGLICMDVDSEASFEAYAKYISANNNLIGIVALQYSPYAGGKGETYWFPNNEGVKIPVITARYSLWNCGPSRNREREGTPAYIAKCYNDFALKANDKTFSLTSVHAWSSFKDTQGNPDLTFENESGGTQESGVTPIKWCAERLSSDFKLVNVEELIWQLRMYTYPEETKTILARYK